MNISCRAVLLGSLAALSMHAVAGDGAVPANASIEQLRLALDSGHVTSEQLVRYYLDRIERFDKNGPHINALIRLNPEILEQARRSDAEAKHKSNK
jgi:Asp-tRNA(Asn)/Glu-tRNA(Gln) amidotransferase A subunit family amidase